MPDRLELIVDGIIYKLQSTGGIARFFTEIFPRICGLEEALEMTILTSGSLSQKLPDHPRIRHKRIPEIDTYLRPTFFRRTLEIVLNSLGAIFESAEVKGKYGIPPITLHYP